MLSTQYPSSNESFFNYNNENSPSFKRSLFEESPFRSCKKRCSDGYRNVESPLAHTNPFKRTFKEEFTESDPHEVVSPSKRSRVGGYANNHCATRSQSMESLSEPRIVDITSGEVLEEVSSESPHYRPFDIDTPQVTSQALVKHSKPKSPASEGRLQILFNIPSNSEPHPQLPLLSMDQSSMQMVPYQPSHYWQEQPGCATLHEIEDEDSLANEMEID
ncbi:hypothetical protein K493DRAFT_314737 [Basidiobolus meristosporus CBS 931.73]|uniref:Uncharacterized protein n=1 Tax=Basidiobolus meristosporus CBS 931.73 TaxID=1314790 RepID=A0A1Y1YE91_9FUNG|nr:hypothetical protein K493DRAFT_314737 [Basidiobolus meristosporus CBS 931.73]|eukprot:ORX96016.1 hypothetical protein K493DRAFT_314737 [Basidiobolus meristosporus CBS 931.73]